MPIVSFKDANISVGESIVVYGLNMEINPGDFVYIVGKVGTGKTSIIRTIIAQNRPQSGSCTVCGYDIGTIRDKDIPFLRRKTGVVFQDFQLLTDRDVHDNLAFVLGATGWTEEVRIERRIRSVLEAVGMETKQHRMPHQLSGGEQQRIAIARAILNDPEIILADEPTGNLDSETADGIMALLKEINSRGAAVVMVTHSKELVRKYPGRVFMCEKESCREITSEGQTEL